MLRPARVHELHAGAVKALDASHGLIASGGADAVVRVIADTGDHAGSYRHADIVNAVAIAPGRVASGSRDRTVRVWRQESGRSYILGEHDHWVMAVAWSPDGERIVSGSEDGTIRLWEPERADVRVIPAGGTVNGVAWGDGFIAAVTGNRRLLVFDESGDLLRQVDGAEQMLWSVAVAPDGHRIAWVGRDRRLRITGEDTITVPAHGAQIWGVTWSGDRILTASADRTVRVWSDRGEAIEVLTLPVWARSAVATGGSIAVAAEDGTVRAFDDDGNPPPTPASVPAPMYPDRCDHWDPRVDRAPVDRCEECGSVTELRLCVTCGHVGCCESQLAHGTHHWEATGHPCTIPVAPGPIRWRWCYQDDMYVKR